MIVGFLIILGSTGPTGVTPENVFGSFYDFALRPDNNTLLPIVTSIPDITGQISVSQGNRIILAPGYYLVSYEVSGLFSTPGYMQITPAYNNLPHIQEGIYFMGQADRSSASGSAHFIIETPEGTSLTLTFNSSSVLTEVQMTMSILKLRRQLP